MASPIGRLPHAALGRAGIQGPADRLQSGHTSTNPEPAGSGVGHDRIRVARIVVLGREIGDLVPGPTGDRQRAGRGAGRPERARIDRSARGQDLGGFVFRPGEQALTLTAFALLTCLGRSRHPNH